MTQSPLTLVAPIADGRMDTLRCVLENRKAALKQGLLRLDSVHYARWVIIPAKSPYRAQLAFESNFDGEIDAHVDALASELGGLVDEIYSNCEGFSHGENAAYLRKIQVSEAAFYQGSPGRTVKTIAQEKAL